jgi:hypothetical protein
MMAMIRSMVLAGIAVLGLSASAYAQHVSIPEIVLMQNNVAHLVEETERALEPLKKAGCDPSEEQARRDALTALGYLKDAIRQLKETTDDKVDDIVAAARK